MDPLTSLPPAAQEELVLEYNRVRHIYTSAMEVASTQLHILDNDFAASNNHSPIHHLESRLKSLHSILEKLQRKGFELTPDNFYRLTDIAGIRVICNYIDDIYHLRALLTGDSGYEVIREHDYIRSPKPNGYRALHLIVNVPFMIAEGRLELPVEIQLRTLAMDMWASLEHELRYKSHHEFLPEELDQLQSCATVLSCVDERMQALYRKKTGI